MWVLILVLYVPPICVVLCCHIGSYKSSCTYKNESPTAQTSACIELLIRSNGSGTTELVLSIDEEILCKCFDKCCKA